MSGALNHYYLDHPALWQIDGSWDGFAWINADDAKNSVYTFIRQASGSDQVVIILNLAPDPHPGYCFGVPEAGEYQIELNSDDMIFGGSGYPTGNQPKMPLIAVDGPRHGKARPINPGHSAAVRPDPAAVHWRLTDHTAKEGFNLIQNNIIAMILAGGQGARLGVLTQHLAKPAVPYGSRYRIIDFPLSNCTNSGIETVGVLTQYQPLFP